MDKALELVKGRLLRASSLMRPEYFLLPVAAAKQRQYRERVYSYELYHLWRCFWPKDFPFSLCGETDKRGHKLILGDQKPDFLVHIPGEMTNLLVMEVKSSGTNIAKMTADLKKLTKFRRDLLDEDGRPANYHAAYFWVYGLRSEDWPQLRRDLLERCEDSAEFDRSLVSCFLHQRPGIEAREVGWE